MPNRFNNCGCCDQKCLETITVLGSGFRFLNDAATPPTQLVVGKVYVSQFPLASLDHAFAKFRFLLDGTNQRELVIRIYCSLTISADENSIEFLDTYVSAEFGYAPSQYTGVHSVLNSHGMRTRDEAGNIVTHSSQAEQFLIPISSLSSSTADLSLCYGMQAAEKITDRGIPVQIDDSPVIYNLHVPLPGVIYLYKFPKRTNSYYTHERLPEPVQIAGKFALVRDSDGIPLVTFFDRLDELGLKLRTQSMGHQSSIVSLATTGIAAANGLHYGFEVVSASNILSLSLTSLTVSETDVLGRKSCTGCGDPFGCQQWITIPPLTGFEEFTAANFADFYPTYTIVSVSFLGREPSFNYFLANSGPCQAECFVQVAYSVTVDTIATPEFPSERQVFYSMIRGTLKFSGLPIKYIGIPFEIYRGVTSFVPREQLGTISIIDGVYTLDSDTYPSFDGFVLS